MKIPRTIIVITAAMLLIYATVSLIKTGSELNTAAALNAELRAQTASISAENESLTYSIEAAHTDEAIESAARHRLGLVKSNDRIFIFR